MCIGETERRWRGRQCSYVGVGVHLCAPHELPCIRTLAVSSAFASAGGSHLPLHNQAEAESPPEHRKRDHHSSLLALLLPTLLLLAWRRGTHSQRLERSGQYRFKGSVYVGHGGGDRKLLVRFCDSLRCVRLGIFDHHLLLVLLHVHNDQWAHKVGIPQAGLWCKCGTPTRGLSTAGPTNRG